MNEQLVKQSSEILELLKQGIITGKDIAVEQLPEICQQLIRFQIAIGVVSLLIMIISILIMCFFINKFIKTDDEKYVVGWFSFGVMSFVSVIIFFAEVCGDFLKALIAPKIFLIEKLAGLFN